MIISETVLDVMDNSGGLLAKCFRIFGKKEGTIGSLLMVSIQSFRSGRKVKKGEVYKAIVIRTKVFFNRDTGTYFKFENNGLILWKRKEDGPVGTRLNSIIPLELRFKGFSKLILISEGSF